MARRFTLALGAIGPLLVGCSGTFTPKTCSLDSECGGGHVCSDIGGAAVCVAAADAPITIGMSAPISGPNQALGVDMKLGILLAFDAQNQAGGIRGRTLVLDFRDDAYQPAGAEQNTRDLLDVRPGKGAVKCSTTSTAVIAGQTPVSATPLERGPNAVLALLGNVGTPTMVRSAPIALETGTLFFGAFTGATTLLRDALAGSCHRYVFNVRASYAEEARASLEFFFAEGIPDAAHVLSVDQADSYGQAGYDGLVGAYQALKGPFTPAPADPTTPIPRFRYDRTDPTSVPAQVTAAAAYLRTVLAADAGPHTVGILITATYGPAAAFITGLRTWQYAADAEQTSLQKASRLKIYFNNMSFVGPNALALRLKDAGTLPTPTGVASFTDTVFISQVVPNYESDKSDIVQAYQSLIHASGSTPSFTSLEGYITASVFIAGLLAHEGPFTPYSLVSTFENLPNQTLGLGAWAGFSPSDHNYSKSVWGTALDANAAFKNRYFWTEGTALQQFE